MRTAWTSRAFHCAGAALVLATAAALAAAQQPAGGSGTPPAAGAPGGGPPGTNKVRQAPQPSGGATGEGGGGGAVLGGGGVPKSKLEEMLEKALRDNPDLKVAAAKVQEAEAELNRTRLEVTRKVIRAHAAIDAAKATVDGAERRLVEIRKLAGNGRISTEEVKAAEQELARAKADLAAAESEVPYLLGHQFVLTHVHRNLGRILNLQSDAGLTASIILDLDRPPIENPIKGERRGGAGPLQGEMAKRIRTALDCPVKVDYTDVPLKKVLKDFDQSCKLVFTAQFGEPEPKVNLHFGQELPLGAALEAIGDQIGFEFFVRDYGILAVDQRKGMPGRPIRMQDFWKAHPAPGAAPSARPDDAQPPK